MIETNRSTLHAIYTTDKSATQGSNDTHTHCHAGQQQPGLQQKGLALVVYAYNESCQC